MAKRKVCFRLFFLLVSLGLFFSGSFLIQKLSASKKQAASQTMVPRLTKQADKLLIDLLPFGRFVFQKRGEVYTFVKLEKAQPMALGPVRLGEPKDISYSDAAGLKMAVDATVFGQTVTMGMAKFEGGKRALLSAKLPKPYTVDPYPDLKITMDNIHLAVGKKIKVYSTISLFDQRAWLHTKRGTTPYS